MQSALENNAGGESTRWPFQESRECLCDSLARCETLLATVKIAEAPRIASGISLRKLDSAQTMFEHWIHYPADIANVNSNFKDRVQAQYDELEKEMF